MPRIINKQDLDYLKLYKSNATVLFKETDKKSVGLYIQVLSGQADQHQMVPSSDTQQLLDYSSQLLQAKNKKLDQYYIDDKNIVSPVDENVKGKPVYSVEKVSKEVNELKENNNKLKNQSSLQKLGLYVFAKEKVQKMGGFWKNFFTFNLGNYFKAHDELDLLKETVKELGYSEKQIEAVDNLYNNGNDKSWEDLEEIDTNGNQKKIEAPKGVKVQFEKDEINKEFSNESKNLSQKVELDMSNKDLKQSDPQINQ